MHGSHEITFSVSSVYSVVKFRYGGFVSTPGTQMYPDTQLAIDFRAGNKYRTHGYINNFQDIKV